MAWCWCEPDRGARAHDPAMSWLDGLSAAGSVASLFSLLVSALSLVVALNIRRTVRRLNQRAAFQVQAGAILNRVNGSIDTLRAQIDDLGAIQWIEIEDVIACVTMTNAYRHSYPQDLYKTSKRMKEAVRRLKSIMKNLRVTCKKNQDSVGSRRLAAVLMDLLSYLQEYSVQATQLLSDRRVVSDDQ